MSIRHYVGLCLGVLLLLAAPALAQTVSFVDANGSPASAYLEGTRVHVRVSDPAANTYPWSQETVLVTLSTALAGDTEFLSLSETGADTGVFEGSLALAQGSLPYRPDVLETAVQAGPPVVRDTLTVEYGPASDTAVMAGARIQLLDDRGRIAAGYTHGDPITVRVEDHVWYNDPGLRDSFLVAVNAPAVDDYEFVTLQETGNATAIFEGKIPASLLTTYNNDGVVGAPAGNLVHAQHSLSDAQETVDTEAPLVGSRAEILDASGNLNDFVAESSTIRLRVIDRLAGSPGQVDTVQAYVSTQIGPDQESFTLAETGLDTGVYEAGIQLFLDPGLTFNGMLETWEESGPPHSFDTVTLSYTGSAGGSSDTATTYGSETVFIDEWGNDAEAYAVGSTVFVRVIDHNLNQPGVRDTKLVTVQSLSLGDTETFSLLETGNDTGVYEGLLPIQAQASGANPGDGWLQAQPGESIQAMHGDAQGYTASADLAAIRYAAIHFFDDEGRPTHEVLEGGYASIRLYSAQSNTTTYSPETATVGVHSGLTGDFESVTVTETGPNTGIFEGTIRLAFTQSGAINGNGILETSNGGPPDYAPDTVTAETMDATATATAVGARVRLIDRFGRDAATFAVGDLVGVRVEDHNIDDPQVRQTLQVVVVANPETGDVEAVDALETGYATGVFEGRIPSRFTPSFAANNGMLEVQDGDRLQARHVLAHAPRLATDDAVMTGSSVLFVDAQGRPAESYLEASTAYVRLVFAGGNVSPSVDTVAVTVSARISVDAETLVLTETGGDTGIFTGSIALRTGSPSPNDGFLQTGWRTSPYVELDTLAVTHAGSSDTVPMAGSRTTFVDAAGSPAERYARNARAYIRVEDHSFDRPGLYDTVQVTVRSLTTGDQELLTLQETARDGGIFAGSLPLDSVLNGTTSPYSGDGKLQADAGEEIEAVHTGWSGATSSSDRALIGYTAIEIVDEAGVATNEALEGGLLRLRVFDPNSFSSTLSVGVQSRYTADYEPVTLTETGYQTHVFMGAVQLQNAGPGSGLSGNGTVETSTSGAPAYLGDELTASYADSQAHAVTKPSRVSFIDGFGRVVSSFAVGDRVGVRVADNNLDDPMIRRTLSENVRSLDGDVESITLTETGFDTNVYEGSIASRNGGPAGSNGTLEVQPGGTIEAEHFNAMTPNPTVVQASMTGASVLFVDASGHPAATYLEGSRAYVRVDDAFASGSVTATLRTTLGPDVEMLTLTETGPGTGVFTGSVPLNISNLSPNDGFLTTVQDLGMPHEFDTLRAEYNGATASAGTASSRTTFVDALGNPADRYARESRAYIRVEDHVDDRPGLYDTVQVTVRSLITGDQEMLTLQETARDGGIFAGSLPLDSVLNGTTYPNPGDGQLQSDAGEEIEAVLADWTTVTSSSDRALIGYTAIEIVDEAGVATNEALEGGLLRLRVFDPNSFSSMLSVGVQSRYGADYETVTLTETGYQSHVFVGTVQLQNAGPGSGLSGNGMVETSTSGAPAYLGDELTASYADSQAHAVTKPSRVWFIDGFGRVVSSFAVGNRVGVRVADNNLDDPMIRRTLSENVRSLDGDVESLTLTETGFDTNVYEGSIASRNGGPAGSNGTLEVQPGGTIEAEHFNAMTPNPTVVQASMTGASVLFVDASGHPAATYLEGSRAYVRVDDAFASGSVTATLRTTLGPDVEMLTLTETGPGTGVFTGSVPLNISNLSPNDGFLTTVQDLGMPHEFDTLRAEYNGATASAGTASSRTTFVDALGNPADRYARDSRAYIRVEDHTFDRPGLYDTVQVTLRSLTTGNQETVTLQETARDGGIFAGSLPLDSILNGTTYPNPGDGSLQSDTNEEIEAVHMDWTSSTNSSDRALITYASIEIVDEAGIATGEALEGGVLHLRVFEPNGSFGNTLSVGVQSRYGADYETVTLTETGYQSHVFVGSVQLQNAGPGSGLSGNGMVETSTSGAPAYLGDELTASYADSQAHAATKPSRVWFIDGFGRVVSSFAVGNRVGVRVADNNLDDPMIRRTLSENVRSLDGDVESITLTETGFDTNVYEGSIASRNGGPAGSNGTLEVQPGGTIEAEHFNAMTPNPTVVQAAMTGASVLFVDAAGHPAATYLEGSRAWVRVDDAFASGSVTATLRTTLGPDVEMLTLTETGPGTGVFTGSAPLNVSGLSPNDGFLTTVQDLGIPHEFDTLRAEYNGGVATVGTVSSRTTFVDALGHPADRYARESRAYVRVEDHTFDRPGLPDTVQVTLKSLTTGDVETLTLQESALDGGIFTGSLPLNSVLAGTTFPNLGDGSLQSDTGEEIEAVHTDWTNATTSSDRARITYASVAFVDGEGVATVEVIEGGVARLRVFDPYGSFGSTVNAGVQSRYGADYESVTLTETAYQSRIFEGTVQLRSVAPGSGLSGNGLLETSTSGSPEYLQDEVTASYADDQAKAVTVASRIWFLNLQSQVVTEYAVGSPVRVRVEDHNAGSGSVMVNLSTPADAESLTLTETGAGTGLFEGSLPGSGGSPVSADGVLQAGPGVTVTAEHFNAYTPNPTRAQVAFNGNFVPLAVDDAAQTEEQPVTIPVLANDSDPDTEPLTVAAVTQGVNGTVVINGDQTVTYTPAAAFLGTDTFTYVAADPRGGQARATVTVTVISANEPPTPAADDVTTPEDVALNIAVLANDTDPDNDTLQVVSVGVPGVPGSGTAVLQPDGSVTFTPAANWSGQTSFSYTVQDPGGLTAAATVTVTVTPVNDAPVAVADSATTNEDVPVTITVLANDTDPDGDVLDVTSTTGVTHGIAVVNADNSITFTPAQDYSGTVSFSYAYTDGTATGYADVTVTINPVNDAPAAVDDVTEVAEDSSGTVWVLTNDSDADGDTLDVTAVTQGANGAAVLNADDTVTYTPNANFHRSDSFTYTVIDGNGGTDTATVAVTVNAANDAPVAGDDTATVAEDGSVSVTVLTNDSDVDGDTLAVSVVTQGTNGAVAIVGSQVSYTPNADFHGTDSFTYTANDGNGGTDTATVTVTITPVNDTPAANDDAASVVEDDSVAVAVLGNDDDVDGDTLTITAVTQGAHGAVAIAGTTVTYTPAPNYNGTDAFTYTVSDGNGGTDTATVTMTITASNDALTANDDAATVAEDGSVTVAVLANDTDPENDPLTVISVTQGTNGSAAIVGSQVSYTPNANFNGTDSFTYTASDGNGGTDTATVTVTVTSVNDAPVANADVATVAEDGSVAISVLANDTDVDADLLNATTATQGTNGAVQILDSQAVYTPNANFHGTDSFTYTLSDGHGGTAVGTVTVTVTGVNDAPVAVNDSASVAEDGSVVVSVRSNDTDVDGDTLTITAVTQGAHGAVTHNGATATYTPAANYNGSDSFTYTISDGHGGTAAASVAVTVTAVNDAPVAVNDTATTLAEVPVTVSVRANDTDVDGDTLAVTAVTQGAHGTAAINGGLTVTYTPATAWVGPDSFTYTLSDGAGGTATATVNVTVQAPPRVTGNLQVLYTFNEGSGTTVNDVSGVGTPLNLTISNAAAVTWLPGALSLNSSVLVQSASAATKVINASKASNEITMEAWVAPDNLTQTGPAVLASIAQNTSNRDVTFGQSATGYSGIIRTSTTTNSGAQLNATATATLNLTHVVYVRSAGTVKIYVNGTQVATTTRTGDFSNWANYKLALGGEPSGTRYWVGNMHLVAIYSRALTAAEVRQNWLSGAN